MKRIAQTLAEMNRKLLRVHDLVITIIPEASNCHRADNHASNCLRADNHVSNCWRTHNHASNCRHADNHAVSVLINGEQREAKLFNYNGKLKLRVTLYETDKGKPLEVKGAVLAATQGAEKGAECDTSAPML
jgi:hypothetical protein